MTNKPTAEQSAILTHIRDTDDSLVVDAKAGTGKTATLVMAKPLFRGSFLLLAFNKSIATELQQRIDLNMNDALVGSGIMTAHAHGLAALRKARMKFRVFGGKLSAILNDVILRGKPSDDPLVRNKRAIRRLASLAKNYGFGITSPFEDFPSIDSDIGWQTLWNLFDFDKELTGEGISAHTVIPTARKLLEASNRTLDSIDFDDMIYLPLLLNIPIPQFDNVVVDEAQDLNHTRRELIFRSIKPSGRIIAVGDPHQAIYGFTGAATDSLDRIKRRAKCPTLPLSICWRCDSAIIREAQKEVPGIQARPNADEGTVTLVEMSDDFFDLPEQGDAILCRLNRPNVFAALRLMALGKRVKIEGRDIGRRLLDIAEQADPAFRHIPLRELRGNILDWFTREEQRLVANNKASSAVMLGDEVEALLLLLDKAAAFASETNDTEATFEHLESEVNNLFDDDIMRGNYITLSSIHKAKGREWKKVYLFGIPDYMPFHLAEADWERVQEHNLIYVGVTRAEQNLVKVRGVKRYLDEKVKGFTKLETSDE